MRATMRQTGCMCTVTKSVVMNRANAKELMNSGVAVYPNPASNMFNIALTETFGKNINIQVKSMSGQIVKNLSVENTGLINVDASLHDSNFKWFRSGNPQNEHSKIKSVVNLIRKGDHLITLSCLCKK
jgi:hypothetical protein